MKSIAALASVFLLAIGSLGIGTVTSSTQSWNGQGQCDFDKVKEVECSKKTLAHPGWGKYADKPQQSLADGKCSTCCPYPKGNVQALKKFSATFTPDTKDTKIARDLDLTPPFKTRSDGINFFHMYLQKGESTGYVVFTALETTVGGRFEIRINHAKHYTVANIGQPVKLWIEARTNLIEFHVLQDPCAGDLNQYYSITIYQPPTPVTPPPKCDNRGKCSPWQKKPADQCLLQGASTVEVACSDKTILPRVDYTKCRSTVDDGKCSCCCPYPAGGFMNISGLELSFTPSGGMSMEVKPSSVENADGQRALMWWSTGKYVTGRLTLKVTSCSVGATFRIKSNGFPSPGVQFEPGQRVIIDFVDGVNFIELRMDQAECAGCDTLFLDILIAQHLESHSSTSATECVSSIERKTLGYAHSKGQTQSVSANLATLASVSGLETGALVQVSSTSVQKTENNKLDTNEIVVKNQQIMTLTEPKVEN